MTQQVSGRGDASSQAKAGVSWFWYWCFRFSLPRVAGFACFAPMCQVLQKQLETKTQEHRGEKDSL